MVHDNKWLFFVIQTHTILVIYYSEYGYDRENAKTCSLVSAVIHGGVSLGAAVSPTLFGGLSEYYSYTTLIDYCMIAMLCMVSYLTDEATWKLSIRPATAQ